MWREVWAEDGNEYDHSNKDAAEDQIPIKFLQSFL
jgi:hypothetical protein